MKKRILAAVLALVMVVTGLYVTQPEAEEVKAAETASTEVQTEMLGIKMQPKIHDNGTADDLTDDTMDLRIVSSVDSLNYKEVGFYVWYGDAAKNPTEANRTAHFRTWTVLERISATSKVTYNFSPKVIDTCSEYFVTGTIAGIKYANWEKDFYIQAYCITMDDKTETGVGRYFDVATATLKQIINIPIAIPEEEVLVGDVASLFVGEKYTEGMVEAYIGGYAHINVQVEDKTQLPSATKIEYALMADGSKSGYSAIYRNLESPLKVTTEGDTVTVTGDTSWYKAYEGENEFVIASAADLYGFAQADTNFAGKTIYMIADIDGNDYKGTATAGGFTRSDGKTPYPWAPIGGTTSDATTNFAGTFDGQMHQISGLYLAKTETANAWGLFGFTGNCTIQNLLFANSSFNMINNTKQRTQLGSIAGDSRGMISTVKVQDDVYLTHQNIHGSESTGGIVGRMDSTGESTISNCWFDGTLYGTSNMGGILGIASDGDNQSQSIEKYQGAITIEHSYNSGTEVLNATGVNGVGGLCGNSFNAELVLNGCLNNSTFDLNGNARPISSGAAVGWIQGRPTEEVAYSVVSNNTYVDTDTWSRFTYKAGSGVIAINGATVNAGYINLDTISLTEAKISGSAGYMNMNLDFSVADAYVGYWTATETTPVLSSFLSNETVLDVTEITTPRTAWYVAGTYGATKEYTLYTKADMYGFASLSNVDFAGKTVNLGADVTMNDGTVAEWQSASFAGLQQWTPKSMAGTFDGKGHTIRGIYVDAVAGDGSVGLFSTVSGSVKDLILQNSYFNHADATTAPHYDKAVFTAPIGSIAGVLSGSVDTVYSDAIVKHAGAYAGGLVGIINTDNASISNSCYAGDVSAFDGAGGILALLVNATAKVEHCLNAGTVSGRYATGGLCGYVWAQNTAKTTKLFLNDSLNVGKHIITANSQIWRGGISGYIRGAATSDITGSHMILDYADGTNTWNRAAFLGGNASAVIDGENTYTRAQNPTAADTKNVVVNCWIEQRVISKELVSLTYYPEGQNSSDDGAVKTYWWVARTGKIPMLESFEDLLTNVTY